MILNETIAKLVVFQQRELDVYSPGYEKSIGFSAERKMNKNGDASIVFQTFDMEASSEIYVPSIELHLDGTHFATAEFDRRVFMLPGDTLRVTYTLSWWWRGGGNDRGRRGRGPSHGRTLRPSLLVPPLSAWDKIQISLAV